METMAIANSRPAASRGGMDDVFRACFDRAPVGIGIAGPDWRLLHANDALCHLFDLSEEELCATAWTELVIPETWNR